MKILHAADLHLGAPIRVGSAYEGKMRNSELLSAFFRLLELAKRESCAAVLLAGDLFDSEGSARALAPTVLEMIEGAEGIDFYYAPGNHEGIGWIPSILPKNLFIFEKEFTYFKKGEITFFGKSSPKPTDFANISLQENDINILVLHGAWGDHRSDGIDIPLPLLRSRFIDYCALGHYHSYEERRIDARAIAVYAGCLEGRGFDEVGEKGAVLIEISGRRLSHRFVPLARRTLFRLSFDISPISSPVSLLKHLENATEHIKREDLLRLILVGEKRFFDFPDTDVLERHFLGRFYYIEVRDETTFKPDLDALRHERSLRGEFIRLAEQCTDVDEKTRASILALGLSALSSGGAK